MGSIGHVLFLAGHVAACVSANLAVAQNPLVPPEGRPVATIDAKARWQIEPAYRGISAAAPVGEGVELRADLDWRDPPRRSGVVWVEQAAISELSDSSPNGVFVTLHCAGQELSNGQLEHDAQLRKTAPPAAFRVCTGLRDSDGNVFWGMGIPVVADGSPTTAGMYSEMRFPLPLGFRSERFDPTRIRAVGVRLDIIDDKRRTYSGAVTIDNLRIVAMPDEFRAHRERIAERIGRENWLTAIKLRAEAGRPDSVPSDPRAARTGSQAPATVPLAEFCENIGVNYPWPAGFYAGVGRRPWKPEQAGFSTCADRIAEDFEYLARHRVRLVRVFLFCDARTGIVADDRGMALDPFALDDIRALLSAAERCPSLRLAPALFDFLIADGVQQEDSNPVGEHPDWIADPVKRRSLFDAIQPALDLLCAHPQVAFIDLMNEPENAAAVDADAMWMFLRELAERVHRHPRRMLCTVGSANAVYAPFWRSTGIDFSTGHWFAKTDATHPLGDHSDALPAAATIMTEVDPGVGVESALSKLWQAGFRGGLFWSLNAGDAYEFRGAPAEAFQRWVEQRMPH
jgi:hypothetical protein